MKKYLSLVFGLFYLSLFSQNNLDIKRQNDSLLSVLSEKKDDSTLARTYRKLFQINRYFDPDKAIIYIKKSQSLVEKMKWKKGMALIYIDMANHYNDTGEHALAIEYYLKAEKQIASIPSEKFNLYNGFFNAYLSQENFSKAKEYSNLLSQIALKSKDNYKIGLAYKSKGYLFTVLKDTINAKKNLSIALKYSQDNKEIKANILMLLGDLEKNLKTKLDFYQESQKNWNAINPKAILSTSNMMGIVEINKEILKNEKLKQKYKIFKPNALLIQESEQLLHKSINYSKLANAMQNEMYAYGLMAEIKEQKKELDSAIYYMYKNFELYENIYSQENKNKIAKLESQKEIDIKNKEIQLNKITLEAKEKQKWFYLFGIGLLAIIGGLLFYQSSNRKKTNQKLQLLNAELDQANKTKTRFFNILNHDLRSPVANLIHFLHLQKDSPELLDEETKNRMQIKTISGAENLLSSMEDILLWSKGQMENFKPQPREVSVNQLFEDTKKVFSGYQKIQFEYQNQENISIFTDENYLKTIIRNLTSNAINVFTTTPNPTIVWKAWQENNISYLSITDNGPGAIQEQFKALYDDKEVVGIKTGLGLHLIRDLAKAIDCEISVDSKPGKGTTFTLKLYNHNKTIKIL
jgi:signal transduction histidine kinase